MGMMYKMKHAFVNLVFDTDGFLFKGQVWGIQEYDS